MLNEPRFFVSFVTGKEPSSATETLIMPHRLTTLSPTFGFSISPEGAEDICFSVSPIACCYAALLHPCSLFLLVFCSARHWRAWLSRRSISFWASRVSFCGFGSWRTRLAMSCQAFLSFRSSVDTETSTFNAKAEGILRRTNHSDATTWVGNDEAPLSAIEGKAELMNLESS